MDKDLVTCDVECLKNYFLVKFGHVPSGKYKSFEMYEGHPLDRSGLQNFLENERYTFITFNGIGYDSVVMAAAVAGSDNAELKKINDTIIVEGVKYWDVYKMFNIRRLYFDHIDIMEVAIGKCSLKIYGGRIHAPKLQDFPIDPDKWLDRSEMKGINKYCGNDLDTTKLLYDVVKPEIDVRIDMGKKLGLDLRSKSDAQIAEAKFKKQLNEIGIKPGRSGIKEGDIVKYKHVAAYTTLTDNQELIDLIHRFSNVDFVVGKAGKVTAWPLNIRSEAEIQVIQDKYDKYVDKCLNAKKPKEPLTFEEYASKESHVVMLHGKPYKIGMGGLHSQEKKQIIKVGGGWKLFERDVASYYPRMIINQQLYPPHLGPKFIPLYTDTVEDRLEAKVLQYDQSLTDKQRKNYAQVNATEKIVINGSFGKFGSPWSILHAPNLLLQTTISGQIGLLVLIDEIGKIPEAEVVSSNTDAVVVHCSDEAYPEVDRVCKHWEDTLKLQLEETPYKALYSRDVNNYIGVTPKNKAKIKGAYKPPGLSKNAMAPICSRAIVDYVVHGEPIEDTIELCSDIREFICLKQVAGGGVWRGEELGKAVRWYYGKGGESIHYKTNGNKVGESDGAVPCMNLPDEFPEDIDMQFYVDRAYGMLKKLGVKVETTL